MIVCPVCATAPCVPIVGTPYAECPNCKLWAQHPLPVKVLHHEHEAPGDSMSDRERQINRELADYLFTKVMDRKPGTTLDVGSKFPWLSKCLSDHLCDAYAMEAHPDGERFALELGVRPIVGDFEAMDFTPSQERFRLIKLIHLYEHLYDPVGALRKLRTLIADDGALFIRMPDHAVSGRENHLTPDHLKIHPFMWTTQALLQALYVARDCFVIESATPMAGAGQTDFLLSPI